MNEATEAIAGLGSCSTVLRQMRAEIAAGMHDKLPPKERRERMLKAIDAALSLVAVTVQAGHLVKQLHEAKEDLEARLALAEMLAGSGDAPPPI